MHVASILKEKGRQVHTVSPVTSTRDVTQILAKNRIGAVVVLGQDGVLAGIISERDIIRGLADHGPSVLDLPVAKLMTAAVTTCTPEDTINGMMEVMTQGHFRHVPVIENGLLAGIVSIGDVVKNRVQECQLEVDALRGYVATSR